jgi:hypothetical protein
MAAPFGVGRCTPAGFPGERSGPYSRIAPLPAQFLRMFQGLFVQVFNGMDTGREQTSHKVLKRWRPGGYSTPSPGKCPRRSARTCLKRCATCGGGVTPYRFRSLCASSSTSIWKRSGGSLSRWRRAAERHQVAHLMVGRPLFRSGLPPRRRVTEKLRGCPRVRWFGIGLASP